MFRNWISHFCEVQEGLELEWLFWVKETKAVISFLSLYLLFFLPFLPFHSFSFFSLFLPLSLPSFFLFLFIYFNFLILWKKLLNIILKLLKCRRLIEGKDAEDNDHIMKFWSVWYPSPCQPLDLKAPCLSAQAPSSVSDCSLEWHGKVKICPWTYLGLSVKQVRLAKENTPQLSKKGDVRLLK